MNQRARTRLLIVTVAILAIAIGVFVFAGMGSGAYTSTVKEVAGDASLVGKRVKVTGTVVAGSWDKRTNPMVFRIREEGASSGPEIKVVYTGGAPNTFGNDSVAIVTGTLEKGPTIQADDMMTKCPSKYSSKSGAATVDELLKAKPGTPMKVHGFLKAGSLKAGGSAERFVMTATAAGGAEVKVVFDGAMPDGAADGASLVVEGVLKDGSFVVSGDKVSLAK